MLNLPASTAFYRRIPKQKFYEELPLTPALRRVFVEQINAIWWRKQDRARHRQPGARPHRDRAGSV